MIVSPPVPSSSASTDAAPQQDSPSDPPVVLRQPSPGDAQDIHRLISECPPLDLNSLYAYLLLSEHFASTCVIAVLDGEVLGFVSAYVPPGREDVLFVWQVAVHDKARGQGLGRHMLQELLARSGLGKTRYVETTVSPDNQASRRMFEGLAKAVQAPLKVSPFFGRELFGQQAHEEEPLIRIGPFCAQHAQGANPS